jgi:hypothetical protein
MLFQPRLMVVRYVALRCIGLTVGGEWPELYTAPDSGRIELESATELNDWLARLRAGATDRLDRFTQTKAASLIDSTREDRERVAALLKDIVGDASHVSSSLTAEQSTMATALVNRTPFARDEHRDLLKLAAAVLILGGDAEAIVVATSPIPIRRFDRAMSVPASVLRRLCLLSDRLRARGGAGR